MIKSNQIKVISMEDQKRIQLEILEEIDSFCREKRIRYSLAFGTLLGAIRHKGYIPWDDDLDIMMPYEDMIRLRDEFKSTLYFFHDIDTDSTYGNPFGNICSLKTYRKHGRGIERGLGIDVYPIVRIPQNTEEEQRYFSLLLRFQKRRQVLLRLRYYLFRHFNISRFPGYSRCMREYRDCFITSNINELSRYYIVAGTVSRRNVFTYDLDLFDALTEVEFEGRTFMAISKYDLYLTQTYGDYMKLPPEEQRHPYHCQEYYWK